MIPLSLGPKATLGPAFTVDLPRPRDKKLLSTNPTAKRVRVEVTDYLVSEMRTKGKIKRTGTGVGNMNKFLEIFELRKSFPKDGEEVCIVRDFSLNLAEGEFVSFIGHSGCGKSTVLSMVAGLTSIDLGGVVLGGREITGPGPDRGVVFQSPCLLPWLTVQGNVALAVDCVRPQRAQREAESGRRTIWRSWASRMLDRKPRELSEGMCQRVGIARAFALSPRSCCSTSPLACSIRSRAWSSRKCSQKSARAPRRPR